MATSAAFKIVVRVIDLRPGAGQAAFEHDFGGGNARADPKRNVAPGSAIHTWTDYKINIA